MSFLARKNSNKIWICSELNKEQLYPYECIQIRNEFQIKIQGIQSLI
jgi:hypothetical protein